MANPSKTKGSNYEKKISDRLTALSNGRVVFKRCPGSGAIGTLSNIPGLQGDIIRADLREIPYIECKKYADFRLENFLLQSGDEWGWVKQTVTNLKGQDARIWVIIFCKDYGRHDWIVTNAKEAMYMDCFIRNSSQNFVITTWEKAFAVEQFQNLFIYEGK